MSHDPKSNPSGYEGSGPTDAWRAVYNLRTPQPEEDTALGTIDFLGIPHHFTAIRVEIGPDGCQRPTRDPYDRYGDLQHMYDGYLVPVQDPPGLPAGTWVICVHPYAD